MLTPTHQTTLELRKETCHMTDQELKAAFEDAQRKWLRANPSENYNDAHQRYFRYFFFAGSEFGAKAVREMHDDAYGEKAVTE